MVKKDSQKNIYNAQDNSRWKEISPAKFNK